MRVSSHTFEYQLPKINKFTATWRYGIRLSEQQLDDYISGIVVSKPKEFSILQLNDLLVELDKAQSTNHIKQLEKEIINNKFANNEDERTKNLIIIELKPFPGKSTDELIKLLEKGIIKEKDFIRNENIDELVEIALQEESFLTLDNSEKLLKINEIIDKEYLSDKVAVNSDGIIS